MNPTISESIVTPVKYSCDVLVVGGGFAGVAAALSAARENKKVVLVEKSYYLGGLGTSGLVNVYLPICDGMGRQVSFGLAEELLKLSIENYNDWGVGAVTWLTEGQVRDEKAPRYEVDFNPSLCAISMEKALLRDNVTILFGVSLVSAVCEDKKIKCAVVEGKSGRYAIEAKSYVDASGDADLADRAGAPTANFKYGNVLAAWYWSGNKEGYKRNMLGYADILPSQENAVRALSKRRYTGLDDKEISEFMLEGREKILEDILKARENDESYVPVAVASIPQFRMTRRIVGEYTFTEEDNHKYFEDSLGMYSNWRKRGPVYELPLRALYSGEVVNLLCAGRCISTDDEMWEISRVIPCCSVMGEAAGLVAALTDDVTKCDVGEVQRILRERGVKLHENEL